MSANGKKERDKAKLSAEHASTRQLVNEADKLINPNNEEMGETEEAANQPVDETDGHSGAIPQVEMEPQQQQQELLDIDLDDNTEESDLLKDEDIAENEVFNFDNMDESEILGTSSGEAPGAQPQSTDVPLKPGGENPMDQTTASHVEQPSGRTEREIPKQPTTDVEQGAQQNPKAPTTPELVTQPGQTASQSSPTSAVLTKSAVIKRRLLPDLPTFEIPDENMQARGKGAYGSTSHHERGRSISSDRAHAPPTPQTPHRSQSIVSRPISMVIIPPTQPLPGLACQSTEADKNTPRTEKLGNHPSNIAWRKLEMGESDSDRTQRNVFDLEALARGKYLYNVMDNQESPDQQMELHMQNWYRRTGGVDDTQVSEEHTDRLAHIKEYGVNIIRPQQPPTEWVQHTIQDTATCCHITGTELSRWNQPVLVEREIPPTGARDGSVLPQAAPYLSDSKQSATLRLEKALNKGILPEVQKQMAIEYGLARPGTIIMADAPEASSIAAFMGVPSRVPEPLAMIIPFVHPFTEKSEVMIPGKKEWTPTDQVAQTRYRETRDGAVFTWELQHLALLCAMDPEYEEIGSKRKQMVQKYETILKPSSVEPVHTRNGGQNEDYPPLPCNEFGTGSVLPRHQRITAKKLMNTMSFDGFMPYPDTPVPPYSSGDQLRTYWKYMKESRPEAQWAKHFVNIPVIQEQLKDLFRKESTNMMTMSPKVADWWITDMMHKYGVDEAVNKTDMRIDKRRVIAMYMGHPGEYTVSWPNAVQRYTEGIARHLKVIMEVHHHRTEGEVLNASEHIKRERQIDGYVSATVLWGDQIKLEKGSDTPKAQKLLDTMVTTLQNQPGSGKEKQITGSVQKIVHMYFQYMIGYVPALLRAEPWSDDTAKWSPHQIQALQSIYPVAFVYMTLRGQAHVLWIGAMMRPNHKRLEANAEVLANLQLDMPAGTAHDYEIATMTIWASLTETSRALTRSGMCQLGPYNICFEALGNKLLCEKEDKGTGKEGKGKLVKAARLIEVTVMGARDHSIPIAADQATERVSHFLKQKGETSLDYLDLEDKSQSMHMASWNYLLNPDISTKLRRAMALAIGVMDSVAIWAHTCNQWYREGPNMFTALRRTMDVMKETVHRGYRFTDMATIRAVDPLWDWALEEQDNRMLLFGRQPPWEDTLKTFTNEVVTEPQTVESEVWSTFLSAAKTYIEQELDRALMSAEEMGKYAQATPLTRQMVTEYCVEARTEVHHTLVALLQTHRHVVQHNMVKANKTVFFSWNGKMKNVLMNLSHTFYLNINSQLQDWVLQPPLTPMGLSQAKDWVVNPVAAPQRMAAQAVRADLLKWDFFLPTRPQNLIEDTTLGNIGMTVWHPQLVVTDRQPRGATARPRRFQSVTIDDPSVWGDVLRRQIDKDTKQLPRAVAQNHLTRYPYVPTGPWTQPLMTRDITQVRNGSAEPTPFQLEDSKDILAYFMATHAVPLAPIHDCEIHGAWAEMTACFNENFRKHHNDWVAKLQPHGGYEQWANTEYREKHTHDLFLGGKVLPTKKMKRTTYWTREGLMADWCPHDGVWQRTTDRCQAALQEATTQHTIPEIPMHTMTGVIMSEEGQYAELRSCEDRRMTVLQQRLKAVHKMWTSERIKKKSEELAYNVLEGTLLWTAFIKKRKEPALLRCINNPVHPHIPGTAHQFADRDAMYPNVWTDPMVYGQMATPVLSALQQLRPRTTRPREHTAHLEEHMPLNQAERASMSTNARDVSEADSLLLRRIEPSLAQDLTEIGRTPTMTELVNLITPESRIALQQRMRQWMTICMVSYAQTKFWDFI